MSNTDYSEVRKQILSSLAVTRASRQTASWTGDHVEASEILKEEERLLTRLRDLEASPPVGSNIILMYSEVLGRTNSSIERLADRVAGLTSSVESVAFRDELTKLRRSLRITKWIAATSLAIIATVVTAAVVAYNVLFN